MATNPKDLAYSAEVLAKLLTDIGLKIKESENGMDALLNAVQSLGIKSEDFLNVNATAVERIGVTIERLNAQLQRAKANNNLGEVFETERALREQTNRQHFLEKGTYQGMDLFNNIDKNISAFTRAGDSIAGSINKYIDFQARIQTLQLDMIRSGWEAISQGQTPFMSKSLQITTEYTKEMIELNAQQNKIVTGTIASTIGTVVGGVVGGFTTGSPVGVMAGASMGTGLISSITSSITEYILAEEKKDIAERMQTSKEMGLLTAGQKDLQAQKLAIGSYLAINNQSTGNFSGVEGNLYDLWQRYAGVPGFDMKEMLPNIKQMGISRQFGTNAENQINMASDINKLEAVTGVGKQEIISYFAELRMKLGVPIDGLVNRFGELYNISDKLQIPLKQVMSDLMELSVANNKYLFTQNQLDTLYVSFFKEIKEGTVSVQDLKKVMEGMSQTPLDKAIGVGALIQSMNPEDIINKSGTNNPEAMRKLLSTMSGMSAPDAGLFLKMVSSPEADKNPFMQQMMNNYGFDKKDLKGMQSEILKVALGGSRIFGDMGDGAGISQFLMEQMSGLFGNQLSPDLYKQGKEIKAIEGFGDIGKGFGGVTDKMKEMDDYMRKHKMPLVELEINAQKKLSLLIDDVNKRIFEGEKPFIVYGDSISKLTKIMREKNNEVDNIIKGTRDKSKETEQDYELGWWDRFRNVDNFGKIFGAGYFNAMTNIMDTRKDLEQYTDKAYEIDKKHNITGADPSRDEKGYSVHIYTQDGQQFNIRGIRTEEAMNQLLKYVQSLSK